MRFAEATATRIITLDYTLGRLLPIGQRVTPPTTLPIKEHNGLSHECVAEAFDTTFSIVILLDPVMALTASTVILSAGFQVRPAF